MALDVEHNIAIGLWTDVSDLKGQWREMVFSITASYLGQKERILVWYV